MSGGAWRQLAAIFGAIAVFLLLWILFDAIFGRTRMQRRIASLRVFHVGERKPADPMLVRWRQAAGRLIEQSAGLTTFSLRSEALLDRAASSVTPPEWLGIRIGGTLAVAVLATFVLPIRAGLPLGAVVAFLGSNVLLKVRITRRERVFADELPNTLQLILSSLRSGFTLQQSVDAAVRDDDGPVAEELRRALSESRINGDFEDALARVGDRIRSQEMIWLVMAIRLQREVGGSLADVMQTTADTMRERAFLRRHVRALSGEGRISAYILVALPLGIGGLLYFTRPEYVGTLFTSSLGWGMIGGAAVLMLIGTFWLSATVKIEV